MTSAEQPPAVRAFHLYTGDDGASHIEAVTVDAAPGPAAPAGALESFRAASDGFFVSMTGPGYSYADHNARRAQVVVVLRGRYRLTCPGGDVAELAPGDVLFAEDFDGPGHTSTDLTGEGGALVIPFADPQDAARLFSLRYDARSNRS